MPGMPDTWSPSTYLRFQDERTRPARDLLAQVPLSSAKKVVDTDLVFANATYQWVPGHVAIFQRILARLSSAAVLAVQMPDNLDEPVHQLMQQVAAESPWSTQLANAARAPLPPVRTYYEALRSVASRLDIWHTIYNHALEGPDAIVEWMRGTGLRPFLDPLPPDHRIEFLRRYRVLIADAYPPTTSGEVLLRFPRLFIVAVR